MRRGDRETQGPVLHIMFSASLYLILPAKLKASGISPRSWFRSDTFSHIGVLYPLSAPAFLRGTASRPRTASRSKCYPAVGLFDRRQKSGVPASQHSPSLLRTPHAGTVRVLADRLLFLVLAGVGLHATTFHCLGQTYDAPMIGTHWAPNLRPGGVGGKHASTDGIRTERSEQTRVPILESKHQSGWGPALYVPKRLERSVGAARSRVQQTAPQGGRLVLPKADDQRRMSSSWARVVSLSATSAMARANRMPICGEDLHTWEERLPGSAGLGKSSPNHLQILSCTSRPGGPWCV